MSGREAILRTNLVCYLNSSRSEVAVARQPSHLTGRGRGSLGQVFTVPLEDALSSSNVYRSRSLRELVN